MSISNAKLLIVEDDPAVRASLERRFRFEGFHVTSAERGEQALDIMAEMEPDLVLLDVMLPGLDGFAVAERIRNVSNVPILMLTAKDSVEDRVSGLERGADDYLVKPFAFDELFARLRALIRRDPGERPVVLSVGALSLDPARKEVLVGTEVVELSGKEFALLELFLRHPGEVLSRTQILDHVWDFAYDGGSNVVDVYVRYLREKLDRRFGVTWIETVRGHGYRLRDR